MVISIVHPSCRELAFSLPPGGMADGRPPKVGGLREDGLTGSVKGGRPTRAASLAKAADGAGIVGAISKFLARAPPQKKAKVTADVEMTTFSSTTTSPAATSSS